VRRKSGGGLAYETLQGRTALELGKNPYRRREICLEDICGENAAKSGERNCNKEQKGKLQPLWKKQRNLRGLINQIHTIRRTKQTEGRKGKRYRSYSLHGCPSQFFNTAGPVGL